MTGSECLKLKQRTERRLARTRLVQNKTEQMRQKTERMREKLEATKERWDKLNTESALSRNQKSPIVDFVDDLVHRPPNTEQMRQLKELLLQEQAAIAQLIALIDRHLEDSNLE
ncbi:hypothetical protein [Microcoleus sp. herbarium12]|uniref:hypothetical protein n=1 Tax=Microcoleus sp. herbarium12 TaxID=3055437 RepID=UPI002FD29EA8